MSFDARVVADVAPAAAAAALPWDEALVGEAQMRRGSKGGCIPWASHSMVASGPPAVLPLVRSHSLTNFAMASRRVTLGLSALLCMGLLSCGEKSRVLNHSSIAARSYVKPSSAATGSTIRRDVIGHLKSAHWGNSVAMSFHSAASTSTSPHVNSPAGVLKSSSMLKSSSEEEKDSWLPAAAAGAALSLVAGVGVGVDIARGVGKETRGGFMRAGE
mmetsp:Transcript_16871/g.41645  ORF Transcript_16871/g.41645 Transcript_16871/m.41645 type:complete len:216 (+) Transcript_16871:3089-3736(+)